MARSYNDWLKGMRETIADYKYYVDFDKAYANVDAIRVELNILNSLVGAQNIEMRFGALLTQYPETLRCIPILLAKREREIMVTDAGGTHKFDFGKTNHSVEDYTHFMRETGLFHLLQMRIISNLVDYVTGVEAGLSSNGRKNRGGHAMENLVEAYIKKAGFTKGDTYFKEMFSHDIEKRWGIDLSALSNGGKATKRFDFAVKTGEMLYAIETNFYASGGSKLNETARSYKTLALEARSISGFTFVWITDGKGWNSARHNLEETFDVLPTLYNIDDMENGTLDKILI